MLRRVQNFVKIKSSVSAQKWKRSTIVQSALKSKAASTPDYQCVGALPSLMERFKNTVVHCADCCSCEKALALVEFGRGIWS